MANPANFLRSVGVELLCYLDDLIFAHPREALAAAQKMLHILPCFGWLVHPTKCVGTTVALQAFVALCSVCTAVCLTKQTYGSWTPSLQRAQLPCRGAALQSGARERRASRSPRNAWKRSDGGLRTSSPWYPANPPAPGPSTGVLTGTFSRTPATLAWGLYPR